MTDLPTKPVPPVTKMRCICANRSTDRSRAPAARPPVSWDMRVSVAVLAVLSAVCAGRGRSPGLARAQAAPDLCGARRRGPRRVRRRRGARRGDPGRPGRPGRSIARPSACAPWCPARSRSTLGHGLRRRLAHQGAWPPCRRCSRSWTTARSPGRAARPLSARVRRARLPRGDGAPRAHPQRGLPRPALARRDSPRLSRRPRGSSPAPTSRYTPGLHVPLQRHRLHPARRAGAARERRAARPVHAQAVLRAARNEGHRLPPARGVEAADRAHGGARLGRATRRRPRRQRAAAGRRGGPRRALLHRRRPRALLPDAPAGRRARRHALSEGSDHPRHARPAPDRRDDARARLGHVVGLLAGARLVLPDGLGRAHRLHRHVDLDRPAEPGLRDRPHEPRPPLRQGQRGRPAPPGERGRGRRLLRARASPPPDGRRRAARDRRPRGRRRRARGPAPTRTGLDQLVAQGFAPAGRAARWGSSRTRPGWTRRAAGSSTCWPRRRASACGAIFSPEHGLTGQLDANVPHGRDAATGLPVWSLYGSERRPSGAMLAGIDTFVFDIQDVGVALLHLPDHPGLRPRGRRPARNSRWSCSTGPTPSRAAWSRGRSWTRTSARSPRPHAIPVRTGMTIGEFARMVVAERRINVSLTVVPLEGWDRAALVRRDRAALGEPVAQYPLAAAGPALLGRRAARGHQSLGGARHRHALRGDRRALDRRSRRRSPRRSTRAALPG